MPSGSIARALGRFWRVCLQRKHGRERRAESTVPMVTCWNTRQFGPITAPGWITMPFGCGRSRPPPSREVTCAPGRTGTADRCGCSRAASEMATTRRASCARATSQPRHPNSLSWRRTIAGARCRDSRIGFSRQSLGKSWLIGRGGRPPSSSLSHPNPNDQHEQGDPNESFGHLKWWSRGESNPRPQVLRLKIYVRSHSLLFSPLATRRAGKACGQPSNDSRYTPQVRVFR